MNFYFTRHAIQRIFERSLEKDTVKEAVIKGEVISEYPEDKPYPSYLSLYIKDGKPLHVVYSIENSDVEKRYIIITVYEPNLNEWDEDFRKRR